MNRTFTVTQLDQQSIGAASDEYEPVPRSFSTQMHLRRGNGDFKFTMFPCSINILAEQTFFPRL